MSARHVHIRHRAAGLAAAALILALVPLGVGTSGIASADTTRTATWPTSWRNPLAASAGGTVTVNANFGAFSLGCTNADRTHTYTYYLPRTTSYSAHLGLDLKAAAGAPVYAVSSGKVVYAGNGLWGTG